MRLMYLTIRTFSARVGHELVELSERLRAFDEQARSFGGTETWEQIDFATKFQPQPSPRCWREGR